jgi:hypothetical protein
MALKLNKVADELMRERLEDLERSLKFCLASTDEETRLGLSGIHYDLGAVLYQQEAEPSRIIEHMTESVAWSLRARERHTESTRYPIGFVRLVAQIVVFGTEGDRSRIGAVPRAGFEHPELPWLTRVADLFKSCVATGVLDRAEATTIETACAAANADRFDREFTRSIAQALLAVDSGEREALTAAIALHLQWHEREAKRGDLKFSEEGLIAMPALGLVQLGREKGIDVDPGSLYVPHSQLPERS